MNNQQPSSGYWWMAAGRAALACGRLHDAVESFDRAQRLLPTDPHLQLQRAIVDHRLGRSVAAADRLRKLIASEPVNAIDATIVLAEVLHRSNQREELDRIVAVGGAWTNDPRAQLFVARGQAISDRTQAITTLDQLARSTAPAHVRRIAGLRRFGCWMRWVDIAKHSNWRSLCTEQRERRMTSADCKEKSKRRRICLRAAKHHVRRVLHEWKIRR